jgi:Uma2 family endonuclease
MRAILDHDPLPWTEEEYFALGETPQRIELFDGSLYVSPAPSLRHQTISSLLSSALARPARVAEMRVFLAVNVRLRVSRVLIPDLVMASVTGSDGEVLATEEIFLVGEILSPSNATIDRVTKMHYYAEAGIGWYLLVDPDGPTMNLFRLVDGKYVVHAAGAPRIPMQFPEPLSVEVDPQFLVDDE